MNRQALSGIKVIEFGEFIAGPYCGKMLASMGAEVIKVEKPGLGDKARSWGPFPQDLPHPEKSGLYLFLNIDKSSVTLNIETALGQKMFKELVKWADVLIENNQPEEMKRLGLDYQSLKSVNPSLIMTSITPFGQTGPFKDYLGGDLINAHTGTTAFGNPAEGVTNVEKWGPLKAPMHLSDFNTGLTAATATMAAIFGRINNCGGQHVDISQQESLASVSRQELAFYAVEGSPPTRVLGRKRRGGILYPCKDGFVCIWIGPHFPKIVKMMGDPDWAQDPIFQNTATRSEQMESFNQLMAVWTMEHTAIEVDEMAMQFGVPASPVRTVKDMVEDAQLEYRHFWVDLDHPVIGKMKYPGAPFELSATPWKAKQAAPLLGEHNEKVFCQMLGYNRKDLVKMRQGGIV
jgi:crotonobetainyl-CoA:carnitine CoA-transferase CaiB-like acyl-CoA transferase